jgi:hypothetical protein
LPPTVLDGALDDAPAESWRFAPGEAISEGLGFEFLQLSVPDGIRTRDSVYSPTSTIAMTGPPPWGPWCIAPTETKTAESPIAPATTAPTAAFAWRW